MKCPIAIMNRQTKVFLLLHCSYQTQHKIINQEKVSGPNPLNDDYIGYSDIEIRYRLNCTSGFFYFLRPRDHASQEFVDISDLINLLLTGCSMGINRYSFPLHRKVYFENLFFNIFP